jgi:hypothetical protein
MIIPLSAAFMSCAYESASEVGKVFIIWITRSGRLSERVAWLRSEVDIDWDL